jgi:formylglycine-generating enzyme required for sulfatase activity
MVHIPAGTYLPLYTPPPPPGTPAAPRTRVAVAAFDMDVRAVTNAEYLAFVTTHPEWRRSHVQSLFADESYLRHWRGDLDPGDRAIAASPVVYVSWFAARAYLASVGKTLATTDEWEYARDVSGRHGATWEWTLDFASALDGTLACGGGAANASDFTAYDAFMRYAMRSSLDARYTVGNVGFRGVIQ